MPLLRTERMNRQKAKDAKRGWCIKPLGGLGGLAVCLSFPYQGGTRLSVDGGGSALVGDTAAAAGIRCRAGPAVQRAPAAIGDEPAGGRGRGAGDRCAADAATLVGDAAPSARLGSDAEAAIEDAAATIRHRATVRVRVGASNRGATRVTTGVGDPTATTGIGYRASTTIDETTAAVAHLAAGRIDLRAGDGGAAWAGRSAAATWSARAAGLPEGQLPHWIWPPHPLPIGPQSAFAD